MGLHGVVNETPFSVLVATTGRGIERAKRRDVGWEIDRHLVDLDVRTLAGVDRTVLAGTQGVGLRRSDDAGGSWERSGLDDKIVKSVSFCAAHPEVVYAGTKPPHVYRSEDVGRTWRELESFRDIRGRSVWRQPAERPSTAYVQALACSPRDSDVVVAGMEAGAVVRTDDGGRTWSQHLKGSCRDCHTLAFHPDGEHVFEGGGGMMAPGVAMSGDRGRTWQRPSDDLDMKYGWAVAADPARPDRVYISLSPGPMRAHSSDNAQAGIFRREGDEPWHLLEGGLPKPLDHMPYALLTHSQTPDYVLAGLSNGEMWETDDAGENWRRLDTAFTSIHRDLVGL